MIQAGKTFWKQKDQEDSMEQVQKEEPKKKLKQKNKWQCFVAKILVLSFLFPIFLPTLACLATEDIAPSEEVLEQMKQDIQTWLSNARPPHVVGYKDKNDEDNLIFALDMPKTNVEQNVSYRSFDNSYVYTGNGNGELIPFDVDVTLTNEEGNNILLADGLILQSGTSGTVIKLITGDVSLDKKYHVEFSVKLPNGEVVAHQYNNLTSKKEDKSFGEIVSDVAQTLLQPIKNVLVGLINDLLLGIADGIKALIDGLFERDTTIYTVIFGKSQKLSIDFWGASSLNGTQNGTQTEDSEFVDPNENEAGIVESGVSALRDLVSYWYKIFSGIVIIVYLVMLLYIGIRILLASTGKAAQKYKSLLTSWVAGLAILAFYPYAMKYIVILNQTLVDVLDQDVDTFSKADVNQVAEGEAQTEGESETPIVEEDEDAMKKIRNMAEEDRNIVLTIIYIVMLGQLIVLIGIYYKRVFMLAFLIAIFPIISGIYIWQKTKGGGHSLSLWTREFVVNVIIQSFHAVCYVVLIEGALKAFEQSNNWFVFIISVLFLFQAEKIIRAIFGVRSATNTIAELGAAGAKAWATTRAIKKIFPSKDSNEKKDDRKDDLEQAQKEADAARQYQANRVAAQGGMPSASDIASGQAGTNGLDGNSDGNNNSWLSPQDPMSNLSAAQALITENALDSSKHGKASKVISKALNIGLGTGLRSSGVLLGVSSGLATGSVKTGLSNTTLFTAGTSMATRGIKRITGYAANAYEGQRLSAKIRSGAMDSALKSVGFDMDSLKSEEDSAKARVIREALAKQASATTRRGASVGKVEFIRAVDSLRRTNIEAGRVVSDTTSTESSSDVNS